MPAASADGRQIAGVQMQRGVWLMPPPHGGYMHQAYGPLHGRYLHGLMADGTSCERFVPDSCYFIPGQLASRTAFLPGRGFHGAPYCSPENGV